MLIEHNTFVFAKHGFTRAVNATESEGLQPLRSLYAAAEDFFRILLSPWDMPFLAFRSKAYYAACLAPEGSGRRRLGPLRPRNSDRQLRRTTPARPSGSFP